MFVRMLCNSHSKERKKVLRTRPLRAQLGAGAEALRYAGKRHFPQSESSGVKAPSPHLAGSWN